MVEPRRRRPTGAWHAPSIDDDGSELHSGRAVNCAEDARVEELGHLKLALATFALQLDAFEMRTHEVLLTVGKPDKSLPLPGSGRWPGPRKDDVIGGQ